jgi:hypothetical protein
MVIIIIIIKIIKSGGSDCLVNLWRIASISSAPWFDSSIEYNYNNNNTNSYDDSYDYGNNDNSNNDPPDIKV